MREARHEISAVVQGPLRVDSERQAPRPTADYGLGPKAMQWHGVVLDRIPGSLDYMHMLCYVVTCRGP